MRLSPEVYLVGGGNFGFNLSDAFDSHVYIVDGGGGDLAMIDTGTGMGEDEIIANMRADGLHLSRSSMSWSHMATWITPVARLACGRDLVRRCWPRRQRRTSCAAETRMRSV